MCIGGAPLAQGYVVAVLALLTVGASALRVGGGQSLKPPKAKAGLRHAALFTGDDLQCPVEYGVFPEGEEPPPVRGAQLLQLSSEARANAAAGAGRLGAGAGRNLSFVRNCPAARDYITVQQMLILPKFKLAFCYIPKVACTQFKDLFNYLNGYGSDTLGFGHAYLASMPKKVRYPMDNITKENGWKFATFTRDPLLRYVSAFGSTCVTNSTGQYEHAWECCGPLVAPGASNREMKRRFEEHVMIDSASGLVDKDGHWVQQSEVLKNCGWRKFKPDQLDFWGHLTGDVNKQVKDMMKIVNYTNDTTIDKFFPPLGIKGHQSTIRLKAHDLLKNQTILMAALKLFEDDYKRFPGIGCSYTDRVLNGTSVLDLLNITSGPAAGAKARRERPARNRTKPLRTRAAAAEAAASAERAPRSRSTTLPPLPADFFETELS